MLISAPSVTTTITTETFERPDVAPSHPLFVVGDVHGLAEALKPLLTQARLFLKEFVDGKVIFLGDLIDRGPDSREVLKLVAKFRKQYRGRVIVLAGNHETLMLGAIYLADKIDAKAMRTVWRKVGGDWGACRGFNELESFLSKLGLGLDSWGKFYSTGNVLCVHAGIEPGKTLSELDEFLKQPVLYVPGYGSSSFPHWAWIRDGFLSYESPLPGGFVVHGHTPSDYRERPMLGRYNLDAGSYQTGCVAAATITVGEILHHTSSQTL